MTQEAESDESWDSAGLSIMYELTGPSRYEPEIGLQLRVLVEPFKAMEDVDLERLGSIVAKALMAKRDQLNAE